MKLRILTGVAGADYSVAPGQVRDDLPDAVAYDLLQSGRAEIVAEERVESTVAAAVEVAVSRGRSGRRRNGA